MTQSKTLVCFDCRFKRVCKHEATALVIIQNHNEGRTENFEKPHVMRLLLPEELKAVTGLPFYEGNVYRSICNCGTILDRKTIPAIEYAMAQHLITGLETNSTRSKNGEPQIEHTFGEEGNELRTIKRSEYISGSKNEEVYIREAMALYGIEREQLSKSTDLAKFDHDIFWINSKSRTFNNISYNVYRFLKYYNCIYCGSNEETTAAGHAFNSFRDLYWHFYREHYIKEVMTTEEQERATYLLEETFKMENNLQHAHFSTTNELDRFQELYHEYMDELKQLEKKKKYGWKEKDDTCLAILQQLVLVEEVFNRKNKGRYHFRHDRSSNALYQLNRIHGISFEHLSELFFENKDRRKLGEKLFHGMVWSENKAPDWLENVIKTLGVELDI